MLHRPVGQLQGHQVAAMAQSAERVMRRMENNLTDMAVLPSYVSDC